MLSTVGQADSGLGTVVTGVAATVRPLATVSCEGRQVKDLFDRYDKIARLSPGLIMFFPVSVTAIVLGLDEQPLVSSVAGAAASVGMSVVLADWVRRRGKDLEPRLWRAWGGPPTTRLLRDRPDAGDAELRRHRRAWVAGAADVGLPTRDEERADPSDADQRYAAAVAVVRNATRDWDQYPVVGHEVAIYGFWRNSLGIRPWAMGLAGLCAALSLVGTALPAVPVANGVFAAVVNLLCLTWWWQLVTSERVAEAAHRYAVHLLEAASTLLR